jgi:hypothetical protein
MDPKEREAKLREIARLEAEMARLREEIDRANGGGGPRGWPPEGYYTSYHVLAGLVLGFLGACTSLLFNVVGSALIKQHPLQLIRVYLTFPLGESALATDDGFTLAMGCLLYMATGMALGVPIHLVLSRFFEQAPFRKRAAVTAAIGIGLWLFNYYAFLSWAQPALFGGDWIVRLVPPWVAALTHLVFSGTILFAEEVGAFQAPRAGAVSEAVALSKGG